MASPGVSEQRVHAPRARSILLGRFLRSNRARFGLLVLTVVTLVCAFAPVLAPYDPIATDVLAANRPPAFLGGELDHFLGTDNLGRDILSRIMYGGRISMAIGLLAVLGAGTVGVVAGLLAGYFGKTPEAVAMRLVDVQLAIPTIILAMSVIAVLGTSVTNLILVMSISGWTIYARTVRATTLSLKERSFVEAAISSGADSWRILLRHILPNSWTPVIVIASNQVASMIILESSLSFLGVGVPPPMPTWGGMIADGRNYLFVAWWITTLPGLVLMLTVLAIYFFGDGLRDVLDPRLRL